MSPAVGGGERSTQPPNSAHKPPLYGSASIDEGSDIYGPDSPASSYSRTAHTTFYGTEGEPYNPQGFNSTDRRLPVSMNAEGTSFTVTDVPPPSYQASLGGAANGAGYGAATNVGKS